MECIKQADNRNIKWLNCAKLVAILAVIVDHTYGYLYHESGISMLSYFSVSLFILVSGMLCYKSLGRNDKGVLKNFFRFSKKIFLAYLLAALVIHVYGYRYFDLNTYIAQVFAFNSSPPHYYVLLYIQLMFVSTLVFNIIQQLPKKFFLLWEIIIGAAILVLSHFTINYSNILGVYGGGGKLFGGTYLFLFYVGMLLSRHNIFTITTRKKSSIVLIVSSILMITWGIFYYFDRLNIDSKLPFGAGKNPPSITLIVWSLILLFFCYGFFSLLEQTKIFCWFTSFCSEMGKHTLYIFLYHQFFLYVLVSKIEVDNIWLKRIVYFIILVGLPIVVEYIVKFAKKLFIGKRNIEERR